MPIYEIKSPLGTRIVQADNQSAAINFVIKKDIECRALSAVQLAEALKDGNHKIETAPSSKAAEPDQNQTDIEEPQPEERSSDQPETEGGA